MKSRILRTGSALSLAAIQQACPAVFATEPHPTRGPRYEYIPTIKPLESLFERGWGVFEATQNQARDVTKEGFCRHSLRLRQLDAGKNKYGGALDGSLELSLSNAHDGTAAYSLQAAYYRMVCSNSMTTGREIAAHRVIHAKGRSTGEIIDVVARIVEDDFPRMMRQIDGFKQATLTTEQIYQLADVAMELRYGAGVKPFEAKDLLKVRRSVDDGDGAWEVLNRIQENVMQGGWATKSVWTGRKSNVRAVEAIVPAQRINQGLWAAAEEMVLA
jgi:hypothetical protein